MALMIKSASLPSLPSSAASTTPDTISRVHELADELDRLDIKNIAKRACNSFMANDMSVIIECWLKCLDKLDTTKLLVGKYHKFSSTIAMYAEIHRVIGCFRVQGLMPYVDQYIAYYKSKMLYMTS